MIGYRNALYLQKQGCIRIYSWNEEGKRIELDVSYEPYIYLDDYNGKELSIFGGPVKRRSFNTQYERGLYVKSSNIKNIYENLNCVQQCLVDTYWKNNEDDDFAKFPLKVYFMDIEAVAKEYGDPSDAAHPINVITIYNTLDKTFYVWGAKPYINKTGLNVKYVYCSNEVILLRKVLDFIKNDPPDIMSGWNSMGYDNPYTINRIKNILGEDAMKELSPVGNLYPRFFMGKFGREEVQWHIDGISLVDYLDIYKRFCMTNRESYKLDYIGEIELGVRKVDYGDQTLLSLMESDWDKFIDYNIQDVNILVKLEEKLQYIALLRMLAYVGCTTFEGAMGTISVALGAAAVRARNRNRRLPTFIKDNEGRKNPGAFVAEPLQGIQKSVVSFDANSLYPNLMISLNLSPEAKIGKLIGKTDEEVSIRYVNGETETLKSKDFITKLKTKNWALTKANIIFSQDVQGIVPELIDYYYKERVKIKNALNQKKRELREIEELLKNVT